MYYYPTEVEVEFDPNIYQVTESNVVIFTVVLRTISQRQITVFFGTNEGSATCNSIINSCTQYYYY